MSFISHAINPGPSAWKQIREEMRETKMAVQMFQTKICLHYFTLLWLKIYSQHLPVYELFLWMYCWAILKCVSQTEVLNFTVGEVLPKLFIWKSGASTNTRCQIFNASPFKLLPTLWLPIHFPCLSSAAALWALPLLIRIGLYLLHGWFSGTRGAVWGQCCQD